MYPGVDRGYDDDDQAGDVVAAPAPKPNAWLKRLKKAGQSGADAYMGQRGEAGQQQRWNPVSTYQDLGSAAGSLIKKFGVGGYVEDPTEAQLAEDEPEYVVPRSKVGNFAASVASGAPVNPGSLPEDDAGPLDSGPPRLGAPNAAGGPPPSGPAPKPLGPPIAQQGPPQLPQAPQLGKPSVLRRIAAGAVGALAGYQNATGRTAPIDVSGATNEIKYPGMARQQANYGMQAQRMGAQAKLDKEAAAIQHTQAQGQEAVQRGRLYGQQADTLAEEGKRAPKSNYITFGGDGLFDASTGETVREPSNKKNAADFIEIAPDKAQALGLRPDKDGKYFIPKEGIGPYLTSTMKPEKPEAKPVAGRDVPLSPEVEAQRKRMAAANRAAGGVTAGTGSDADDIAQAIIDGKQPPDMKGLYRFSAPVRAKLAKAGYDMTTAQRDWQAVQKHIATLNGTQQERLRQAVNFTYESLDQIEQLYGEWKNVAGVSGIKILNRGNLAASKHLPGKAGEVATLLEAQINDLTSELGTVYKGGNGSTDESLRLAGENLKADWNDQTFKRAVGQIRNNLRIRRNSINNSEPAGMSANSQYAQPQQGGSGGRGATPAGKISVTAPDRTVHSFDTQAQADAFKKLAGIN